MHLPDAPAVPDLSTAVDISVIIVSWNAQHHLERCLSSLATTSARYSREIIVVDNASSDGSPEMVEADFPGVKVIRNRENLGFARANNIGIRASRGRYVSLMNSDVELLDGCLDRLADYLEEHPQVGNAGPQILNADQSLQGSCRNFPSLWNNFCEAAGLSRLFSSMRLFSGEQITVVTADGPSLVDALSGCFWMLRRDALAAVGLLDENFFMYSEDVDWCQRCWSAGWHIVYVPEAQAIHYGGGSSANAPARFAVEQQRAQLQYWAKHHGAPGRMGIRAILLFRHLLRYGTGLAAQAVRSSRGAVHERRMQLSRACMRALVSNGH